MDAFVKSCEAFLHYPTNIVESNVRAHSLQAYHTRLKHQADRLFVDEKNAAVSFLDLPQALPCMLIGFFIDVIELWVLNFRRYLTRNLNQP